MKVQNKAYKEMNINPLNKKNGDCVINSIGIALNKSWDKVFEELVEIAKVKKGMLNDKSVYEEYLKSYHTIPVKYNSSSGNKRFLVKDVCTWDGVYIISIAKHFTVVKDGILYDRWDCSNKSIYKIWRIR